MQNKTSTNKRILIVGAGITGLALAALLERRGINADIVERAPDWKRSGYGITVMPTGLKVLRELGALGQVRQAGGSATGLAMLDADGTPVRHLLLKAGGIDSISLARADLHAILRSQVRTTPIQMGVEVKGLRQADGTNGTVTVEFSKGPAKTYDLVVGTDGIRSRVRQIIFPEAKPHYTGAAVWTFFLPEGVSLPSYHEVQQVWNEDEFMGIFPFKHTAAVTFSAPLDSKADVLAVDLAQKFADIHVLAKDILAKVSKGRMYAGYLNEMKLHDWYKGRVLLAGDAAHAMMPATGMGSSMGMADAKAIADLVANCNDDEWEVLPQLYQHKRKRQTDQVQREAYLVTQTMFMGGPLKNLRDGAARLVPQFVVSHALNRL